MPTTAYWAPNQALVAQVETYTLTTNPAVNNTLVATINGKTVTYICTGADTITTAMANFFALLSAGSSVPVELAEITFANPSAGVITATAKVAGTPFANVPGTTAGLTVTTGNGMANGITTAHTTANASPSDVSDAQNWLRINTGVNPPTKVRQLPQNGDDGVLANTSTPMSWNLDQIASVQFNTLTRWDSMTGQIGLPETNANGYTEWRAKHLKVSGPQGSVPAGGLQLAASQQVTLTVLDGTQVDFLGIHTQNAVSVLGGVTVNFAMNPGEVASLNNVALDGSAALGIGQGVTWTAGSTLTMLGGVAALNSAPPTLAMANGAQATIVKDGLTWAAITAQNGSSMTWLAGGTITSLTMTTNSSLDKSQDARALTVTNSTIDGDTCFINDPLNAMSYTNPTTVKQRVLQGPFRFTGTRTMKLV
jgi:hypothetical protein